MAEILVVVLAYVLGSTPFGVLIAKRFCNIDPREAGSRNTGATNVARLCGTKYGVMALGCDILKGMLPVLVAQAASFSPFWISLAAFAAVLGHVYSVFLGFKGGKAVATTIGVLAPIAFTETLLSVGICVAAIAVSGFVSLGSLVFVTAMPVLLVFFGKWAYLPLSAALLALVYWRHRENIQRLAKGEEKPWRGKKGGATGETTGETTGGPSQDTQGKDR